MCVRSLQQAVRLLTSQLWYQQSISLKIFSRQALHSYSLSFVHPFTKEKLNFESKLPKDIELLKKAIEEFI